jgi:hypothetical protein
MKAGTSMPEAMQSNPEVGNRPEGTIPSRQWSIRIHSAYFLAALVLMIVSSPFFGDFKHGVIPTVLVTLVFLSAVLAIGGSYRTLVWGGVLSVPAVVGKWANYWWPKLVPPEYFLLPAILFTGFIVFQILRFTLRAPKVNSGVLCAAIANYLMLGLLWSFSYALVDELVPDSFSFSEAGHTMTGFNGLYFSFATLCTVGYGDISPVSNVARILAMAEAVVGMVYMTVLVARLVSMYSGKTSSESTGEN